jgi:hypothetical protein
MRYVSRCAASMRAPARSFHSTGAPVRQLCSLPPCSSLASKPAVAAAVAHCSLAFSAVVTIGAHAHRWCTVCATCIACARRLQSAFKLAVALGRIDAALLLLDSPITAVEAESPSRLQLRHTCLACAVETWVHTRSGPANMHTHTRARTHKHSHMHAHMSASHA